MFTHKDIWNGIDRLATAFGYSPSGLAKQAGLDSTSFNKSKRFSPEGKPRWPSTESIAKVLAVTGATMSDFISLIDKDSELAHTPSRENSIPLIGFAQAGKSGFFDEDGYPAGGSWDEVQIPGGSAGDLSHAFALKVSGDSMDPVYRQGDILVLSPTAKIKRGDRVVVKTRSGQVMAKELERKTKDKIDLKSLNPEHEDHTIHAKDLVWMARILWVSQ